MTINIIDLGIGNVNSIRLWLQQFTESIYLIKSPNDYKSGSIIIPGVCSSSKLMRKLNYWKFDIFLKDMSTRNTTILGICAGFQVLTNRTYEEKKTECLGIIDGETYGINNKKSITGWKKKKIEIPNDSILRKSCPQKKYISGNFYFNHSYAVFKEKEKLDYVFQRNIIGLQFHPEKSRIDGIQFIPALLS